MVSLSILEPPCGLVKLLIGPLCSLLKFPWHFIITGSSLSPGTSVLSPVLLSSVEPSEHYSLLERTTGASLWIPVVIFNTPAMQLVIYILQMPDLFISRFIDFKSFLCCHHLVVAIASETNTASPIIPFL